MQQEGRGRGYPARLEDWPAEAAAWAEGRCHELDRQARAIRGEPPAALARQPGEEG
jgi:hypothetical protein